ncbi:NAD(P)-dependent oxidoreductase [Micromonospora sp. RTGN7]|uniref:NAD(P)-dependent oxidoreductase n=1 Tax=Micromonospora sp. RTGN7 TaxID=3016526 RepID=UPI0029FEECF9|nr:NAD(P)-dependent oxidoreductase [Micromonospora sp. RTGN7]
MSNHEDLAFIGLGAMGGGMARALCTAGFSITVFNRTRSRAEPLAAAGARVVNSPAEAADGTRVVVLSLSDEQAVEEILFGQLVGRLRADAIVVDTSTVSPAYAIEAGRRLAKEGVRRVEACVLGNPAMAQSGALRVFTAGREEDVAEVRTVLDTIGQEVRHVGGPGSASALKLAFNLILGNQIAALAEAVRLTDGAGVDRDMFLTALTASGFSSPTLAFRAEMVRGRRSEPAHFRLRLMHKDLALAVSEAAARGNELPVTAAAAARFAEGVRHGDGDRDAVAIVEAR